MENVGHFGEQRDEFENLRVPDGSRLIQVEKVLEFFLEIALKSCQLGLLIDFWFTLLASPGIFSTIRSLISPKEWALAVLHVFQLFDLLGQNPIVSNSEPFPALLAQLLKLNASTSATIPTAAASALAARARARRRRCQIFVTVLLEV